MPVYIKLHGPQRSGTNYLTAILKLNFSNIYVLTHKKHDPIPEIKNWGRGAGRDAVYKDARENLPAMRFIVITKNPYAWGLSWLKYRAKVGHSGVSPTNPISYEQMAHNLNNSARSWLELKKWSQRCCFVRHDDLLHDFNGEMVRIEKTLALERKGKTFENIMCRMHPTREGEPFVPGAEFTNEERSFYLGGKYLEEMRADCRRAITKTVDWEVMKEYGYHSVAA
jgi:hypothetical protein